MGKILYINSCTRPESRTDSLAKTLLQKLQGEIEEIRLYDEKLVYQNADALLKREALVNSENLEAEELKFANQFAAADTVVISAPYWDLLFPAVLRTYLEMVMVCGITFRYSSEGRPEGLCRAKKLYYVVTAGGYIGNNNFGFNYVKTLAELMFGIEKSECFSAEGLDIYGADVEKIMQQAKNNIYNSI